MSGSERLVDARNEGLALSSRFDLAYNAAHAFSLAALRWHGYRSHSRYLVFQVLPHTLGLPTVTWRVLAKAHEVRNVAEYEGHFDADVTLLRNLIGCIQSSKIVDSYPKIGTDCTVLWMKIYPQCCSRKP